MPKQYSQLKRQLFSGEKQNIPGAFWQEAWLVDNWPDYVGRSFANSPKETLEELRKIVADKKTPKVEAGPSPGS